jgi:hypothetical protein
MLPGRAAGDTPTVVSLRLHCGFRGVREKRSRTFSGQSVHIPSLENECPTVAVDRETNYENDPLAVSAIYLQRAITAGSRSPSALVGISRHDFGRKIGKIHLDKSWLSFALTEPCPQGLSSERTSQEFLPARLVILIQILRTNRVGYGGTVDNSNGLSLATSESWWWRASWRYRRCSQPPTSATAAEGRGRGHPRTLSHGRRDRPATGGTG